MTRRNPLLTAASALAAALGASLNGAGVPANQVPVPRIGAPHAGRLGRTARVVADGRAPYRRPRPAGVRAAFDDLPRRQRRALERAAATIRTPHQASSFRAMVDALIHDHHAAMGAARHG